MGEVIFENSSLVVYKRWNGEDYDYDVTLKYRMDPETHTFAAHKLGFQAREAALSWARGH